MLFFPPLPKFIEYILKVETPAVHFQVTLSRLQQATLRKAGALQTATLARAPQQHGKKLLRWCSFILQACHKMQSYSFIVRQKTFFPQSCKLNTSSLLKTKPRKTAKKTLISTCTKPVAAHCCCQLPALRAAARRFRGLSSWGTPITAAGCRSPTGCLHITLPRLKIELTRSVLDKQPSDCINFSKFSSSRFAGIIWVSFLTLSLQLLPKIPPKSNL